MKTVSAALLSHMQSSQQALMADLLTITLIGGTVLRYTSADIDVTWNGYTFSAFVWERNKVNLVSGLEVDTLNIIFYPRIYPLSAITAEAEDQILDKPFFEALRLGALDGAQVQLERAYFSSWAAAPVGTLIMFSGQVADIEIGQGAKVTVKSGLEILNRPLPRFLYQSACIWALYDSGCGLNKAVWAVSKTVITATSTSLTGGLSQADDYFTLGVVRFDSGELSGLYYAIRSYEGGVIAPTVPFQAVPAYGDAFTVWPGCDHSLDTCDTKFSNSSRFGGQPFIPVTETAY
jgi:uncharacterized phage protein (TIGR02218 family)